MISWRWRSLSNHQTSFLSNFVLLYLSTTIFDSGRRAPIEYLWGNSRLFQIQPSGLLSLLSSFYAKNTKVNYNWFKYGIGKEKKSGEGGQKGGHYTGRKENKEGKRMEWQGREKWKEYGDEGIRKLTRNERKEGLKKGMETGQKWNRMDRQTKENK